MLWLLRYTVGALMTGGLAAASLLSGSINVPASLLPSPPATPAALCGNSFVDQGETCDITADDPTAPCRALGLANPWCKNCQCIDYDAVRLCGNGARDGYEDCGEHVAGMSFSCTGTKKTCTWCHCEQYCHNGFAEPGEQCGEQGLPACSAGKTCIGCQCLPTPVCRNNVAERSETCGEPGLSACPQGQYCDTANCQCRRYCGNRVMDPGEQCELNAACPNSQTCTYDCQCSYAPPSACGNGIRELNEQCEVNAPDSYDACKGVPNDPYPFCTQQCGCGRYDYQTQCGNGVQDYGESCGEPGLGCANAPFKTCTKCHCSPSCGNGTLELGEQCGESGAPVCTGGKICNGCQCVVPNVCGNGKKESAEQCDDANAVTGDGCTTCLAEAGWSCSQVGGRSLCVRNTIVSFVSISLDVSAESSADLDVLLVRTGGTQQTAVQVAAAPGATAVEGREYRIPVKTVSFASGEMSKSFRLSVIGQPTANFLRTATLGLSGTSTTGFRAGSTSLPVRFHIGAYCGDGQLAGTEQCDDHDADAGDGCSGICQIEAGWSCSGSPSVCTRLPICGDGVLGTGETCDDDNTTAGDGCSATCRAEAGYSCTGTPSDCRRICGNGIVQGEIGEYCDDGGRVAGDGCSPTCTIESGYGCTGNPSVCRRLCGNGNVEPQGGETCDDGDTTSGDGCSSTCFVEEGFTCWGSPSDCAPPPVCGDGVKQTQEACDDGNAISGDGCSPVCFATPCPPLPLRCSVDFGYECTGNPSVCVKPPVCRDGVVEGSEACDDGNGIIGDGCRSDCIVESGYACTGSPSICRGICGNGSIQNGETCDDGGRIVGDGCSPTCAVEANYSCTGIPSVCQRICGNGIVQPGEACDDNNMIANDGCSRTCTVEAGYVCATGNPSVCIIPPVCGDGRVETGKGEQCEQTSCPPGAVCIPMSPQCGAGKICQNCLCSETIAPVCGNATLELGEECDGSAAACGDVLRSKGQPSGNPLCNNCRCIDYNPALCGNTVLDATESCGDTHPSTCVNKSTANVPETCTQCHCIAQCGDGIVDRAAGEQCGEPGLGTCPSGTICQGCACRLPPGVAVCQNGIAETGEECDDGNAAANDGCSASCEFERGWVCDGSPSICINTCGNGMRQLMFDEECDDGDRVSGDGCSATCAVEAGFACTVARPDVCTIAPPECGNGVRETGEACDDDNTIAGDGCTATCPIEAGFVCTTATPNVCTRPDPVCGNGVREAGEQCDPLLCPVNAICIQMPQCSTGRSCANCECVVAEPSCGNGVPEAGEACDDNNTTAGDGCSATCTVETGFTCSGSPSICMGPPVCGDDIVQADRGEQCESADDCGGTDACVACACRTVGACGNGVVDSGELTSMAFGTPVDFKATQLFSADVEAHVARIDSAHALLVFGSQTENITAKVATTSGNAVTWSQGVSLTEKLEQLTRVVFPDKMREDRIKVLPISGSPASFLVLYDCKAVVADVTLSPLGVKFWTPVRNPAIGNCAGTVFGIPYGASGNTFLVYTKSQNGASPNIATVTRTAAGQPVIAWQLTQVTQVYDGQDILPCFPKDLPGWAPLEMRLIKVGNGYWVERKNRSPIVQRLPFIGWLLAQVKSAQPFRQFELCRSDASGESVGLEQWVEFVGSTMVLCDQEDNCSAQRLAMQWNAQTFKNELSLVEGARVDIPTPFFTTWSSPGGKQAVMTSHGEIGICNTLTSTSASCKHYPSTVRVKNAAFYARQGDVVALSEDKLLSVFNTGASYVAALEEECDPVCGNAVIETGEECENGTACSGNQACIQCQCITVPPPPCGDGNQDFGEACDDANTRANDGCSAACTVEAGFSCSAAFPSVCSLLCGNGSLNGQEECDLGALNGASGGTCTAACRQVAVCGNGKLENGEVCDDENLIGGEGCSAVCRVEAGWACVQTNGNDHKSLCGRTACVPVNEVLPSGMPPQLQRQCCAGLEVDMTFCYDPGALYPRPGCGGKCVPLPICGDGIKAEREACDDGNVLNGDGCSGSCRVETGYACAGDPSRCMVLCGNSMFDPGEQCDGANFPCAEGYTCSNSCWCVANQPAQCGNGKVETGENCEQGIACSDGSACTACRCAIPDAFCGNGKREGQEQCDGLANKCPNTLRCNAFCQCISDTGPVCGDGIRQTGEECDGNFFLCKKAGESCTACKCVTQPPSLCGNGILNPGEVCDSSSYPCPGGQICQGCGCFYGPVGQ